ncbi:MAG: aminotransferase class V-fold PLP-dependent enzyme [Actinobacteria bacterium]|nr:aminotransferase class V-fold PLP-dependent enzyme [Actinomycetota bacterium]
MVRSHITEPSVITVTSVEKELEVSGHGSLSVVNGCSACNQHPELISVLDDREHIVTLWWLPRFVVRQEDAGEVSRLGSRAINQVGPDDQEVIALGTAVDYLTGLGMHEVRRHEIELSSYVLGMLKGRFGDDITIHGPSNPEVRGATFSFAFRGIHPHDLSQVLDQHNVCVRAGHHCAKPLMRLIGANATARASFYLYNTTEEADALADALESASDIF